MKKVLLTTTAIVGLTAPAFAADPTAVSDQPYFHHSHPMTWSGDMSITLSNPSSSDIDTAKTKAGKRDALFNVLTGTLGGEETAVGRLHIVDAGTGISDAHDQASVLLSAMRVDLNAHTGYTLAAIAADAATTTAASAVEDIMMTS